MESCRLSDGDEAPCATLFCLSGPCGSLPGA